MEIDSGEFFGIFFMVMHLPFKDNLKITTSFLKLNFSFFFLITISFSYGMYTLGVRGSFESANTYLTKP